jgi:hypothetical protein
VGEGSSGSTGPEGGPLQLTVVTFNTGTNNGLPHDSDGDDYGNDEADLSDEYYGDGLAWVPAIDGTAAFFAALQPEVVVFQELFWSGDCPDIPPEYHAGFACENWQPGDPSVVQLVLGDGYQVACHLEKPDKCAAVRKDFGGFAGCDEDLCLDHLDGAEIEDCGGGSRVGRGVIELVDGGSFTLVNYHGTSGILPADMACRVDQIEQIFVDLDGQPAVSGEVNLVMGDFNTDPYRAFIDLSAARWLDFVGQPDEDLPFWFVTDAGPNATPTYNLFNIDHVVSDAFTGTCVAPGVTAGEPAVLDTVYFDHVPQVCDIVLPR